MHINMPVVFFDDLGYPAPVQSPPAVLPTPGDPDQPAHQTREPLTSLGKPSKIPVPIAVKRLSDQGGEENQPTRTCRQPDPTRESPDGEPSLHRTSPVHIPLPTAQARVRAAEKATALVEEEYQQLRVSFNKLHSTCYKAIIKEREAREKQAVLETILRRQTQRMFEQNRQHLAEMDKHRKLTDLLARRVRDPSLRPESTSWEPEKVPMGSPVAPISHRTHASDNDPLCTTCQDELMNLQ